MTIKKTDGTEISLEEVLTYRVSSLEDTGKPVPWYVHGDENSVAVHLGIKYEEIQAARLSAEWQTEAQAWADSNGVDYKHVKHAIEQPGRNGGMTKAQFEEVGRTVVEHLEDIVKPVESDDEEYITDKEWVDNQLDNMLDDEFAPTPRTVKPQKSKTAADKEKERIAQALRDDGVDEEVIKKTVYGE